jgi:hypothetical protein
MTREKVKTIYGFNEMYLIEEIAILNVIYDTTLCDKVCQWLATGRWFSPGTPVSSTNKIDLHDITEILLKVRLNTITLTIEWRWNLLWVTCIYRNLPWGT